MVKTKRFAARKLPIDEVDWEGLIPLIGLANRELAKYDGILYAVPNPEVLLSPITTQEAVLSSKMEGTQATLGDVLQFDAGLEPTESWRRDDIWEIINYRRALQHAKESIRNRPFNLGLLKELHEILLNSVRGRDKSRGRFRTEQNWIGKQGSPIEQADFIPPAPQELMELLHNWESYYHAEEKDPVVQLALVHAQFEIIHPFLDGNGRIGRMLIPLFLSEREILSAPMFYLSNYLEKHRDLYIEKLRALDREPGAWNEWISFFLIAIVEQARENARKAMQIVDLYESLKPKVVSITHSQYAVPLLDAFFNQPFFGISDLKARDGMPSVPTISQLVGKLESAGVIRRIRQGRGQAKSIYVFAALINICEGKEVY